jgi:hypothetical protein
MGKTSQDISNGFQTLSKQLYDSLKPLETFPFKSQHLGTIHCDKLPDYSIGPALFEHEEYKLMFDKIKEFNKPVVYWFEIESAHSGNEIYDMMKNYRNSEIKRNSPALKKTYDVNSRILYVGKVKKDFRGRIFVHLGYYHVVATAGLQLSHWAKECGLKLNLHVIELPLTSGTEDLATLYEIELAKRLKPLVGKHK